MALHDPYTVEEGDPATLRAQARELRTVATNIHTVTEMLQRISTKGVWESGSGCAFAGEVGQTPEVMYDIANRLGGAARILDPHADELERAQRRMKTYRERYEAYDKTAEDKKAELATMTPDDPDYSTVNRDHITAADNREWTKRRYQREGESLHEDELSVKRQLEALGADSSDPKGYDLFEGVTDIGSSVVLNNLVADFVKPAKVATFAEPVGMLGQRVVYGEGSYRGVAASTGRRVAGLVKLPVFKGSGAKAADAARKKAQKARVQAIKDAGQGRSTNPIARTRIGHNVRTATRTKGAQAKAGVRYQVNETIRKQTGARLVDDMAADWASVAGAGRVRKGAHVLKYTAATGAKAQGTVGKGQKTSDAIRSRTHDDEEPGTTGGSSR